MRIGGATFAEAARRLVDRYEQAGESEDDIMTNPARQSTVHTLEIACEHVQTPLNRLEHGLHSWVAFLIMPIFALANAGVPLTGVDEALTSRIGLGIVLGLFLGKPIGILLFTFAAKRLGLGDLPTGSNWGQIAGASLLAGIGFTMSLFIANLAFEYGSETLISSKAGILCGSLISGVVGYFLLRAATKRGAAEE
jgi:NhaA family Na+:H+ antiporter